jgi:cation:H+ antiporter
MTTALVLVAGLVLLAFASDWFVLGAARLSTAWSVPALVVGAVVVGFGTSAPELVVTVLASTSGEEPLAVGNIIGSNLANLTLVLGSSALAGAVVVDSGVLRREAPLSTLAVCLFAVCCALGLGVVAGSVLLTCLAVTVTAIIVLAGRRRSAVDEELEREVAALEGEATIRPSFELGRTAVGLAGTLLGAQLVVQGAVASATALGLSEGFVGLTIVAVGTSLPELVTSVRATRRGEDDLVVGNVLGSNLFNSLAAGSVIGLVGGGVALDAGARWALVLMVAVALAAGALLVFRRTLGRVEAAALLVVYGATIPVLAG